jgi:hypothetical protein
MFVFPLVENEISETSAVPLAGQSGQQPVVKGLPKTKVAGKENFLTGKQTKTALKSKTTKLKGSKESLRNTYSEEPVVKDSLWNIYTGNPGFYVTEGDTVNFGNVTTLSDSAFLEVQHTIVPTTIKPYGFVGKELVLPSQEWILGLILILWMIFASVRVQFFQYLDQLFASLVNFNAATRLFHQRGYKTMYGALRLDFIFHLIVPLSVYQIATFFKVDIPGLPAIFFFFALLLVINGYFFAKILLYRMAGSIVMLKEQTEESVFNIKLYYKALGICLLPIVTIHTIIPETNIITIWVMAALIVIMYISTAIRSIYLGNRKDISIFYLILYLCTLEILPLLLIFKLMGTE